MKKLTFRLLVMGFVFVSFAGPSLATIASFQGLGDLAGGDLILDQACEHMWEVALGLGRNWWVWQEFRPTMDNLEQVDVYLDNAMVPSTVTVSFQVRDGATVLWDTSFSADLIGGLGWFEIDTPQIPLVPDNSYRLYLTSDLTYEQIMGGADLSWEAAQNDPYSRGISSWDSDIDFAFHTWAVPEPGTICLLGLGGLAILRRKQQQFFEEVE